MDLALIERLILLLETSSVNELEYSENGARIRLAKSPRQAVARVEPAQVEAETPEQAFSVAETHGDHAIVAGLVGTFYRAPAPGAEPFVATGDRIEEGQILGIIEAMKMMNPVEADRGGIVAGILVDDAAPVAAGTVLFRLEEAG